MRDLSLFIAFFLLNTLHLTAQDTIQNYRIVVFDSKVDSGSHLEEQDGKVLGGAIRDYLVKLTLKTNIKVLEKEDLFEIVENEAEADKLWGVYDENTAVERGKFLRANYVVLSKIETSSLYEGIRIRARLVNVETGAIEVAEPITYNPQRGFDKEIDKLCRALLYGITEKVQVKREEIRKRDTISYTSYVDSFSYHYETTLRRFDHLFDKLYIAEAIPEIVQRNATLNMFINQKSQLIAVYAITDDGLENITFNEEGFCWRFLFSDEIIEDCIYWSDYGRNGAVLQEGNVFIITDMYISKEDDYYDASDPNKELYLTNETFPNNYQLLVNMFVFLRRDSNWMVRNRDAHVPLINSLGK